VTVKSKSWSFDERSAVGATRGRPRGDAARRRGDGRCALRSGPAGGVRAGKSLRLAGVVLDVRRGDGRRARERSRRLRARRVRRGVRPLRSGALRSSPEGHHGDSSRHDDRSNDARDERVRASASPRSQRTHKLVDRGEACFGLERERPPKSITRGISANGTSDGTRGHRALQVVERRRRKRMRPVERFPHALGERKLVRTCVGRCTTKLLRRHVCRRPHRASRSRQSMDRRR
jgi:hypothetical protein